MANFYARYNGGIFGGGGGGSTLSIGALDSQPENANGLALVSNVLSTQSADATHPGVVNNTSQTFAGTKTFNGGINTGAINQVNGAPTIDVANFFLKDNNGNHSVSWNLDQLTDTNNALSLDWLARHLVNPSGVTLLDWSGSTLTVPNLIDSGLTASQLVATNGSKQLVSQATGNLTDVGTDGITITGGTGAVIGSGTSIAQQKADATHNGYLSSADWSTFNGKGSGTVTAVSVASANGFAGSSSGGATPALTLSTSVTGLLKGNGTAISAAASGTDYAPATSGSSILYGNGSGGFSNVTVGTGLSFSAGTLSATSSGGAYTSNTVTQAAHGFSVGQLLYLNGSTYTLAIATSAAAAEVVGIVASTTTNTFVMITEGYVTGLSGLTAGTTYYLSTSSAGALTATIPSTTGQIIKPVLNADSTTSGYFNNFTGVAVGAAAFTNPMTTLGDIIYENSTPAAARLAGNTTATKNFLTQTGTGSISAPPAWGTISNTDVLLSVASKTANYTLVATDSMIVANASGGAFTLTLPTAVGNTGLVLGMCRTDSTVANQVSINTTSAQTIGGFASGALKLATQNEVWRFFSDGTNWQILDHRYSSSRVAFTPAYTGISTLSNNQGWWWRVGSNIYVTGNVTSGVVSATKFSITIPAITIDTSTISSSLQSKVGDLGILYNGASNAIPAANFGPTVLFYDGSVSTTVIYMSGHTGSSGGSGAFLAENGNYLYAGSSYTYTFAIPVSGWSE